MPWVGKYKIEALRNRDRLRKEEREAYREYIKEKRREDWADFKKWILRLKNKILRRKAAHKGMTEPLLKDNSVTRAGYVSISIDTYDLINLFKNPRDRDLLKRFVSGFKQQIGASGEEIVFACPEEIEISNNPETKRDS